MNTNLYIMRFFFALLFFAWINLNAQSVSHVFPGDLHPVQSVVVDTASGIAFVEHYDDGSSEGRPIVSAIAQDGNLLWSTELMVQNDVNARNPAESGFLDLNNQHLLYIGWPEAQCDLPAKAIIVILLDKSSGEQLAEFALETDDLQPNPYFSYAADPSGNRFIISFGTQTLLFRVEGDAFSHESVFNNQPLRAVVFREQDSVSYVIEGDVASALVSRDLNSSAEIYQPIPFGLEVEDLFYLNGEIFLRTTEQMYSYGLEDQEPTPRFSLTENARVDTQQDKFFVFDPNENEYYQYTPADDQLSQTQVITNTADVELADLIFASDSSYHLIGQYGFDGQQTRRGFWLRGLDEEPSVTANYALQLEYIAPPDPYYFTIQDPQNDPSGLGGANIRVAYTLRITNTGSLPVGSASIERKRPGGFFCGPFRNPTESLVFNSLQPSESILLPPDTAVIYMFYNPSGVYNFNLQHCIGRPNGELEISYGDNCATTLISSTNKVAKQNIQLKAFPNPATDAWQITQLPKEALDWTLISTDGLVVRRGSLPRGHGGQLRIGTENLPGGLYRLNVRTATPSGRSRGRASLLASINLIH